MKKSRFTESEIVSNLLLAVNATSALQSSFAVQQPSGTVNSRVDLKAGLHAFAVTSPEGAHSQTSRQALTTRALPTHPRQVGYPPTRGTNVPHPRTREHSRCFVRHSRREALQTSRSPANSSEIR